MMVEPERDELDDFLGAAIIGVVLAMLLASSL